MDKYKGRTESGKKKGAKVQRRSFERSLENLGGLPILKNHTHNKRLKVWLLERNFYTVQYSIRGSNIFQLQTHKISGKGQILLVKVYKCSNILSKRGHNDKTDLIVLQYLLLVPIMVKIYF